MEIDQSIGLAETEYLKKPELPSSIPNDKVIKKKKRVVSQKQLDSLKRAREASVLKRKKIKEQKLKDKEEAKALKKKPIQVKEPEVMETIEEERYGGANPSGADTPEELIDMNTVGGHSFNYEKVIGGVFDMIQADKERRKPEKEARWDKRFKDAEDIRIDERNKLLDLVKQMERADSMKSTTTKKEKPKPKPKVNPAKLLKGQPDWDSCFAPRRGGNNFF